MLLKQTYTQEINMFTSFDTIIDTIQGAQTKFVETYVTDKKVQAELVKLTEAQAKFAKGSYQTSLTIAQAVYKTATEAVQAKKAV
jgi:hypothetical protein